MGSYFYPDCRCSVQMIYLNKHEFAIIHSSSFVGKDFLTLKDFSGDEIKSLLWTALDLKHRIKSNNEVATMNFILMLHGLSMVALMIILNIF